MHITTAKNHSFSLFTSLSTIALTLLLSACGGGGGETQSPNELTGVFIDSAVSNIGYQTETRSGTTNSLGEFTYISGETVQFFIGDLRLPAVQAKGIITPLDIAQSSSITDNQVTNIVRLLLSFDQDGDASNGIQIPSGAVSIAVQVDFNVDPTIFASNADVINMVANSGSVTTSLVSVADAQNHLDESLTALKKGAIEAKMWQMEGQDILFLFTSENENKESFFYYIDVSSRPSTADYGFSYGSYTVEPTNNNVTLTIDTNFGNGIGGGPQESITVTPVSESEIVINIDGVNYTFNDVTPTELDVTSHPNGSLLGVFQAGSQTLFISFNDFILLDNNLGMVTGTHEASTFHLTESFSSGDLASIDSASMSRETLDTLTIYYIMGGTKIFNLMPL